jgi:hypothetical protein
MTVFPLLSMKQDLDSLLIIMTTFANHASRRNALARPSPTEMPVLFCVVSLSVLGTEQAAY